MRLSISTFEGLALFSNMKHRVSEDAINSDALYTRKCQLEYFA